MKKIETKEIVLGKKLLAFVDLHPEMTSANVVNHFELEGFSRSTLYNILKRNEKNTLGSRK